MRAWPAFRQWRRRARQGAVGLCAAMPLAAACASGWESPSPRVQDLHYGTVLYAFYQQDYFTAITRLMAAQQRGRLTHHADEAAVVLGGLKLGYGLDDDAEAIFRRLLTADIPEHIRNRVWLYLARIQYRKGQYADAERSLARLRGDPGPEQRGERQMLLGLIRMAQADFSGAAEALQAWRGEGALRPYAQYNLAVAQIRSGNDAAGLQLLDRLGRTAPSEEEEYLALRDKANLAAAEALLRAERPRQARDLLDRVRLHGPYSNQALLWSGMASGAIGDFRRALVPWGELLERGSADPMVQEALLAVPHAYTQLEQPGRAAARLEEAITILERERRSLRQASAAIEAGQLRISRVLQGLPGNGNSDLPLEPLVELLVTHPFHQVLQNYLDLQALQQNLEYWAAAVGSFDDMLEAQEAIYAQRLPQTREQLQRLDLEAVAAGRDALRERFRQAEQGDAWLLATAEEQRRWQRLEHIESRLSRLPQDHPDLEELVHRQRLLQGLVRWDVETDFTPRLWQSRQQLRALDMALGELEERRRSLDTAERHARGRFDGFAERIADKQTSIARLRPRVEAALHAHEAHLQRQALAVLQARDQALEQQLLRARYALAGLHAAAGVAGAGESGR